MTHAQYMAEYQLMRSAAVKVEGDLLTRRSRNQKEKTKAAFCSQDGVF
jgi:hypothetical protein